MKNLLMFTAIFFISLVSAQDKGVFQYHEGAELYRATHYKEYQTRYGEIESDVEWVSFNDPKIKEEFGNPQTIIEKFVEGIAFHSSGLDENGEKYETINYGFYVGNTAVNYTDKNGNRVTEATMVDYNFYYHGFYHIRGKIHTFITRTESGKVGMYKAVKIQ